MVHHPLPYGFSGFNVIDFFPGYPVVDCTLQIEFLLVYLPRQKARALKILEFF